MEELIKLKGTGDGVKIYLSAKAPFQELLYAIQDKLRAWRKFFGTGHCNMYFIGRELDKSDTLRLEAVVRALLPECTILYGEKRSMGDTVKLPEEFVKAISEDKEKEKKAPDDLSEENKKTAADIGKDEQKPEGPGSTETGEEPEDLESTRQFELIREVVTNNFKSSRARLFEGAVKAGRVVESDGHLILVGNVERGGTLIANGNVIVIGALRGSVQAGCMGNKNAYIIALDMRPTDLRIAHAYAKYDENTDDIAISPKLKRAYLINNDICIDEILLKM